MKNIYFVQVSFDFDNSIYLPYAAGTIIAYCKKYLPKNTEYSFEDIIFTREKLDDAMQKIKEPFMVQFSCNVWNMQYNKALAKRVKESFPECLIVFGGHSISPEQDILSEFEFIDYLVFGEGEETTLALLNCLAENCIEKTPNIAYRLNGKTVYTNRQYFEDLSAYPSPYSEGIFRKIIAENKNTDFLAVLETNRGCPYNCAYCDWCAGKKTRLFPIEKVYEEIRWFSENKIEYVFCADSNFGMFQRDVHIAQKLIDFKRQNGYPKVFRPCYEKNTDDRVFEICSKLNEVQMDKGATMAYQTLSQEALENIGRKNLTMEHFSSLLKKYVKANIPTYSELILGLPGETKESFCKGICSLLENGQHNSISVYHCEVLPNSELGKDFFLKKHGIEVIRVAFNHIHSAPKATEEIKEYSYIVRSTNTMSRDDWVYSNLFSVCVQCFHSLGLFRFIAVYVHNKGISTYYDFYTKLLDYILSSTGKLNRLFSSFKKKYENSLLGDWNYFNNKFGHVTWFFEEGAFLELSEDLDGAYQEAEPFLRGYFTSLEFEKEIIRYNKMMIRIFSSEECAEKYSYDFKSYFDEVIKGNTKTELEKRETEYKITPKEGYETVAEYAKRAVWFGRRRGETVFSGQEIIEK